jgi:hypothetical protein
MKALADTRDCGRLERLDVAATLVGGELEGLASRETAEEGLEHPENVTADPIIRHQLARAYAIPGANALEQWTGSPLAR